MTNVLSISIIFLIFAILSRCDPYVAYLKVSDRKLAFPGRLVLLNIPERGLTPPETIRQRVCSVISKYAPLKVVKGVRVAGNSYYGPIHDLVEEVHDRIRSELLLDDTEVPTFVTVTGLPSGYHLPIYMDFTVDPFYLSNNTEPISCQ